MDDLFDKNSDTIGLHIRNIFKEKELGKKVTTEIYSVVQQEGGRTVRRSIRFYNLDMFISVGYGVNSKRGTQFRIWAKRVPREHLTCGLTINRQRLETNAREIEAALELVRRTIASPRLTADMSRGIVEVITRYTQTYIWLQRYDAGTLAEPKEEPGGELPTAAEAVAAIAYLEADLMTRNEAGELFGQERGDGLVAIIGNLQQSVFGEPGLPQCRSQGRAPPLFHHQDPSLRKR